MLGIWHGGDWMKRDLAQPICGRVECGSPSSGWFLYSIIKSSFFLYLVCKCTSYYVDCIVVVSIVFLVLLCWL